MEIIARLTGDAVVKTTQNDRQVVNFNVAINDSYKSGNETKKIITYVQCDYWGNPAIAQYLTKGSVVELYGRIGVNAYLNSQGEARASITFRVGNIKLHGGSKTNAKQDEAPPAVMASELLEPVDNLPF